MHNIQFKTDNIFGTDGSYHITLSKMLKEDGIVKEFPYIKYPYIDQAYNNPHFLLHVLYIPFTFVNDFMLGAKYAAFFFASLSFILFYFILISYKVKLRPLWMLLLFGASYLFLYRINMPRVQSLIIIFILLGLYFLKRKWHYPLATLSFFNVWLSDSFIFLGILVFLYSASKIILEKKPYFSIILKEFKEFYFYLLGTILGLIINFYFPANIPYIFHHYFNQGVSATLSPSAEWGSYTGIAIIKMAWPALSVFFLVILIFFIATNKNNKFKISKETLAMFIFSSFLLFLALSYKRGMELWPLITILFAALVFKDIMKEYSIRKLFKKYKFVTSIAMILFILFSIGSFCYSYNHFSELISSKQPTDKYKDCSIWLKANTEKGSLVFPSHWGVYQQIIPYNTHNQFLLGFEPYSMSTYNSSLFSNWYYTTKLNYDLYEMIDGEFEADYVFVKSSHKSLINELEDRKEFTRKLKSTYCSIYSVEKIYN